MIDLKTEVIIAAEIYHADEGDTSTIVRSVEAAQQNLVEVDVVQDIEKVVADKGYHKAQNLVEIEGLSPFGIKTYVPEPQSKYERGVVSLDCAIGWFAIVWWFHSGHIGCCWPHGDRAMVGMNWDEMTAEERLLAEQLVLNMRSLNRVARLAPDGHVLDVVERLAMEQGRELVRRTIELSLHAEGTEVEKKVARRGTADVG